MEMYIQLIKQRIEELSKLIFNVDEMLPRNETQGQYKYRVIEALAEARADLRQAVDEMEWFDRKAG